VHGDLRAQRDHPEIEHARRDEDLDRPSGDLDLLTAEAHRDGRVRDLDGLCFTTRRQSPLGCTRRQQLERPVERDGVAHVEQAVHDRFAVNTGLLGIGCGRHAARIWHAPSRLHFAAGYQPVRTSNSSLAL
jgi:hypothetical protein